MSKFTPERLAKVLWAAALLSLPVTSFRYFPFLGKTTYVRPLAIYPLALLAPLLLLQFLRRKKSRPVPGSLIPLGIFILIAAAATVIAASYAPVAMRGHDYWDRALRAWVTMVIGLMVFLSACWMNQSREDLLFSLKWLLAGLVMNILWSGIQGLAFYTPLINKTTLTHWQLAFSMRELVRTNRISGMAYEPSWLAGQLTTMYLPWLVAAVLSGFRVSRAKWLEPVLLVFSGGLLVLTYSRGGLFIGGAAAGITLLLAGRDALQKTWIWLLDGFRSSKDTGWDRSRDIAIRLASIAVLVLAFAGSGYILMDKGYISQIFEFSADSLQQYIIDNYAGARVAYAVGALGAYEEYPWTGAGLGGSGFHILENLPDWSLTTVPEIANQLSPQRTLFPNPKNLYIRLLAETGIFGFWMFLIFLFSVLGDVFSTLNSPQKHERFLGIAALFAWIAILLYNLTQDSFATPNMWLIFGILAGMAHTIPDKKEKT
ncbi:MAG: O-antigen ligase family protein [Anaerolineales bacterium]|nr:O-antigen ligase family protein [Anaerolineales bacterium]